MMLALGKLDKNKNFRYYYIHDYQESLFKEFLLTVIWGKNQERGRHRIYSFRDSQEMRNKLNVLLTRKIREGYHIYYSYPDLKEILSDIGASRRLKERIERDRKRREVS